MRTVRTDLVDEMKPSESFGALYSMSSTIIVGHRRFARRLDFCVNGRWPLLQLFRVIGKYVDALPEQLEDCLVPHLVRMIEGSQLPPC